ncbi:hypothetical protein Pcinc_042575 [Petrolisthes cinctipes]|uniref:Uncharacterized protein n=1 Tax=Petrolisthes cinctipes TaxID=88211 RepID=A0AAE1BI50_PETCI|nr:hypothetical protein Pcinc_042575 [Petrolisthes cinctipes]
MEEAQHRIGGGGGVEGRRGKEGDGGGEGVEGRRCGRKRRRRSGMEEEWNGGGVEWRRSGMEEEWKGGGGGVEGRRRRSGREEEEVWKDRGG